MRIPINSRARAHLAGVIRRLAARARQIENGLTLAKTGDEAQHAKGFADGLTLAVNDLTIWLNSETREVPDSSLRED